MSLSKVRQNFHSNSEAFLNKQLNMELYASYVYMSMYAYFDRDDVALHGFAKFFKHSSEEEREHAFKLVAYQNMRGGRVVFQDVAKPAKTEWGSALEAVEAALELEKTVNQSLLELHKTADESSDPQLCDFIESEYLKEQVEAIKELGDLATRLKRAGAGIGEHIIDKELGGSA
jgi:ferritin heavy chain